MDEYSYAIIGMNRYGIKLGQALSATGVQVLIADNNQDTINLYADKFTYAVCLDLANSEALNKIGLDQIDIAIVDLSDQLESAIVSVMVCKEQGVKKVIATARSDRFREVMLRVGADEVVIPEDTAAAQMARLLISEDFMAFFDIGGGMCILKTKPKPEWKKKSLRKLMLPENQNIKVIAIEQEGTMTTQIRADTVIPADCDLAIAIPKTQIYDMIY